MPAATGGVRVEGLRQTVRALENIGVDVNDLKDAFATIAAEGAEAVARHAPVQTGNLASSIRGNRAKSKAVVRAGKAAVPYAGAINYGWPARNIAPANYMGAGEAEYTPRAVERLESEIESVIRKSGLT